MQITHDTFSESKISVECKSPMPLKLLIFDISAAQKKEEKKFKEQDKSYIYQ